MLCLGQRGKIADGNSTVRQQVKGLRSDVRVLDARVKSAVRVNVVAAYLGPFQGSSRRTEVGRQSLLEH